MWHKCKLVMLSSNIKELSLYLLIFLYYLRNWIEVLYMFKLRMKEWKYFNKSTRKSLSPAITTQSFRFTLTLGNEFCNSLAIFTASQIQTRMGGGLVGSNLARPLHMVCSTVRRPAVMLQNPQNPVRLSSLGNRVCGMGITSLAGSKDTPWQGLLRIPPYGSTNDMRI